MVLVRGATTVFSSFAARVSALCLIAAGFFVLVFGVGPRLTGVSEEKLSDENAIGVAHADIPPSPYSQPSYYAQSSYGDSGDCGDSGGCGDSGDSGE